MVSPLKGLVKCKKGSVLIEFAIALPILLLIFFGIVQMTLIYNAHMLTAYTSYSSAREVALGGDINDARRKTEIVFSSINRYVLIPYISSLFLQTDVDSYGDTAVARVNYTMPIRIPMVGKAIDFVGSYFGIPTKDMGTAAKMVSN